jgi:shikimate dehydrogenase
MTTHKKQPSILVGLIGSGIRASLTPPMHEHEGDMQGMRYLYRIIDLDELGLGVSDLPDLLLAAERMGFTGLNITHPCKQAVVELLDELSDVASRIGAVNTVVFERGRRIGHNTDAWGFIESFREEIAVSCPHDRIFLLGVGGAGTAIANALLVRTTCSLEIHDEDRNRAREVASRLADVYGTERVNLVTDIAESLRHCDGLVNATPVGMQLHPGCPIDASLLRPDLWVADIIYFPMETELVKAATETGCRVMTGGGMAVYQAVRAFERFTNVEPDRVRMKAHFASLLEPPASPAGQARSVGSTG